MNLIVLMLLTPLRIVVFLVGILFDLLDALLGRKPRRSRRRWKL
jgi:hypothetical protein